jgi:hypothetical protein
MRAFACEICGQLLFFENSACLRCGAHLAFDPAERELRATQEPPPRCANAEIAACNWRPARDGELCASCVLTTTRPADGDAPGLAQLAVAEAAKRRLLFELAELGLPFEGLRFDLLSSTHGPVTTGHADGLITLDLAESDDARRERLRMELGEPYRTVLGHLRHETGHALWPVLAPDEATRERAREHFGDEREDYGAALERHYDAGPPEDWAEEHVSAYATMQPSEDWAETTAHLLHIWDAVQTAASHGLGVAGPAVVALRRRAEHLSAAPVVTTDFDDLIGDWLPLTYALNAMNRSMGKGDLYPFVLTEPVLAKLRFVHDLVTTRRTHRSGDPRGG